MRLGTVVLALTLGLGAAGLVQGEEEAAGSWWTRVFNAPAKAAPEPGKADSKAGIGLPVTNLSTAERIRRAEKVLNRRREVCVALAELADQFEDDELKRKVDILEQRAWDAYKAAVGSLETSDPASPARTSKETR